MYYDENEYFFIVGRLKELIKYKGFQVTTLGYPSFSYINDLNEMNM